MWRLGLGGPKLDEKTQARQDASIQSIQTGGLPLNAIERLTGQAAKQGTAQHFFTSDLSVNELLLTAECGYQPLGQVMGSAVFQIGIQYLPGVSGELKVVTEANILARKRAMDRLQLEASMLKADGVVGVRLVKKNFGDELRFVEFLAIGTAVRSVDKTKTESPFLSALTGQEHWALREAGCSPVGFAYGYCSYFQAPDWRNASTPTLFQNKEYTFLTQGLYTCREIATDRMLEDFRGVSATGVVGVTVETGVSGSVMEGLIYDFVTYGTAITRHSSSSELSITPTLSLRK